VELEEVGLEDDGDVIEEEWYERWVVVRRKMSMRCDCEMKN
jgi:hypothetical protein